MPRESTQKIDTQPERENFLKDIAKVLVKTGKKEEAAATFTRAIKIAFGIEDKERQENTLQAIALAQTEVGQFVDALETAKLIGEQWKRSHACMNVAVAQARARKFSAAIVTASNINESMFRAKAYETIAMVQAQVKDFLLSALITASEIENSTIKARTLQTIAVLQAQESPLTNDAFAIAQKIEHEFEQTNALLGIVKAQAEAGKFDIALKTKSRIEDKEREMDALGVIAEAYAKATNLDHNFDEALKITEKIEPSWKRVRTLVKIAQMQAEAGQFREARDNLATAFKSEFEPKPEIKSLKAIALYRIAQIQLKNQEIEEAIAITRILQEIVKSIKNTVEKARVLALIAEVLGNSGKTKSALNVSKIALEITQRISGRDDLCSEIFQLIAQIQALAGEFDTAFETAKLIKIDSLSIKAVQTIAELQIVLDPQQKDRWKKILSDAHDSCGNKPIFLWNYVNVLSTIAVAFWAIGDKETAQATFSDIRKTAQAKQSQERDRDLSTVAAALAKVGEISTALEIANEIEDGSEEVRAFWAIAWRQFSKGEKVTTLDAALKAKDKIKDEQKRVETLSSVAAIQALAGKGEEAMRTVEEILSNRNIHLSGIASLLVETGDKNNFKRLLVPCAYYLDSAYNICGYLARLYPQNAQAIAKVVENLA